MSRGKRKNRKTEYVTVERRIYDEHGNYIHSVSWIVEKHLYSHGPGKLRGKERITTIADLKRQILSKQKQELKKFRDHRVHEGHVSRCECGVITTNVGLCMTCLMGYVTQPSLKMVPDLHGERAEMSRIEEHFKLGLMGVDKFFQLYESPTRPWYGREDDIEWW